MSISQFRRDYHTRDSTLGYALELCNKLQTREVYAIEDPAEKVHVYRLERPAHARLADQGSQQRYFIMAEFELLKPLPANLGKASCFRFAPFEVEKPAHFAIAMIFPPANHRYQPASLPGKPPQAL